MVLKLKAYVNVMKKAKSQINVSLISKENDPLKLGKKNKLAVNGKEICDQAKINNEIKILLEEVFKCHKGKSYTNPSNILSSIDLPCLTNEQKGFCKIELREKGNHGLSKEFYEAFWN